MITAEAIETLLGWASQETVQIQGQFAEHLAAILRNDEDQGTITSHRMHELITRFMTGE